MIAWFAHVVVGYLVRIATRLIKGRGSDQWPRENATVWSSNTSNLYGGGVAEIIYSYSHNGHYFSGTHEKQFISYDSANRYVAGFPKGTQIVARVKPGHPKTSILRDDDQDQVALKLKTRFE
jgi:Protein of unknown function (DUF3592)